MKRIKALTLLIFYFFPTMTQAKYIDTRDLSNETKRIQRLLGQIDVLNQNTSQRPSNSSDSAAAALALAGITATGLAIATAHSHTTYYRVNSYSPYYGRPRPYPTTTYRRTYHNNAAAAVGTAIAAAGIIGLIATAAEASTEQANTSQSMGQSVNAQKEITTIISNLVLTDEDYITESQELNSQLSNNTIQQISAWTTDYSNSLLSLEKRIEDRSNNFVNTTNQINLSQEKIISETQQQYLANIEKITDPNISKTGIKELKKFNKDLKKQEKSSLKELKKTLKQTIKEHQKSQKAFTTQIAKEKEILDQQLNSKVKDFRENLTKQQHDLMLKYINLYSVKLTS